MGNGTVRPPPPPGFVPMGQDQDGGDSFISELGRQLGLTGRALVGGAAQVVEPFTEPVRYLMNQALPGNPIGNIESATDEVLTSAGVPEPQGALEEGVQDVGRFMTSVGMGVGAGSKVDDMVMGATGLAKQPQIEALTTAQLRELADASYKAADDAGVVVRPESFRGIVARIKSITDELGVDETLHPQVTAAMKRLQKTADAGEPLRLKDIEILRSVVRESGDSLKKGEQRMSGIMREQLDDYIYSLGPGDIAAGDPQVASNALRTARNLWSRMSKSETIEEAIRVAGVNANTYSGAGFENALRIQFKQIARQPRRMRGFTAQEKDAIERVAMGAPIQNSMRILGKLAPTGVISGGISSGAGYAMGGPVGAVALPLVGMGARKAATEMTKRNVENLSDMVRRGAPAEKGIPDWLLPWLAGGTLGINEQGN